MSGEYRQHGRARDRETQPAADLAPRTHLLHRLEVQPQRHEDRAEAEGEDHEDRSEDANQRPRDLGERSDGRPGLRRRGERPAPNR